jgi:hypothetical protein
MRGSNEWRGVEKFRRNEGSKEKQEQANSSKKTKKKFTSNTSDLAPKAL